MTVKGPRVYPMVVIADRLGRRRALLALLLLSVGVITVGAWFGGRYSTLMSMAGTGADINVAIDLGRVIDENRVLRDELAVYRSGGEVTHAVEERVRIENRELQDRVAELEQAIAYYRRVAIPDRSGKGLRVERLALSSAGTPAVWLLEALLVRTGETDGVVEGRFEGRVIVEGPSGSDELLIAQVLPPGGQQFRVRYVEDIKAELRLPPGTRPLRVDLVVVLTAPRPDRIEKSWHRQAITKPQETPANAGQG